MTANMYRVGDYVYFESASTAPYQIRRIEELNKTATGNVEAKVMCFYRRRDLPSSLVQLADKHQLYTGAAEDAASVGSPGSDSSGHRDPPTPTPTTTPTPSRPDHGLTSKQRHQMKHRELFLSRQVENVPATHIRGKCSVTLFNETESLCSYLAKDDTFFYCLVYDPTQRTLLADKGEIRVGSRYQCEVPHFGETRLVCEDRRLEELVWTPAHGLSDRQIDQFLVVSRSVGTFARALDCSSSVKQPSLHMSAAAASRDVTLFHAMRTLHAHGYDLAGALCSLVPQGGPVLCRDEMEEWSASEANLFEEALDKYGKDFGDIRQDFLPWKTLRNVVEYYYMWKTTDRYVQQKRVKAVEAESRLKQVYIPNYNKPGTPVPNNSKSIVNGGGGGGAGGGGGGLGGGPTVGGAGAGNGAATDRDPAVSGNGKPCESCNVSVSSQWYAWGPSHMQCRLCHACWQYWKRYGGLKAPTRLADAEFDCAAKRRAGSEDADDDKGAGAAGAGAAGGAGTGTALSQHRPHRCHIGGCAKEFKLKAHLARHYASAHGMIVRQGSPGRPVMKTRTAFYLSTTPLTRVSRRLCRHITRPRHAARAPFFAINIQAVKQECAALTAGRAPAELGRMLAGGAARSRGRVAAIATRLGGGGGGGAAPAQWLVLTDRESLPRPDRVAFPRPPTAPDGSLVYERVPNAPEAEKIPLNASPSQQQQAFRKRAYDECNGIDSAPLPVMMACPPPKRLSKDPASGAPRTPSEQQCAGAPGAPAPAARHIAQINGKPKLSHMTRIGSGRKQVISWMDAPDDVYFRATDSSRKHRRQITLAELRRAARKPWRSLRAKGGPDDAVQVVVLD